jgi:predicted unusual protein kinase regulating ubiquinone biosynthesis (AarF/ABC1/UbiB family)
MVDGIFHADPHPGNIFLLAVDRGDPAMLTDALL